MPGDVLQAFVDQLASLEASLNDPTLRAAIGPGLFNEASYLVSAGRQRFPNRWPGDQQALPLEDLLGDPS
jgi:hypothetical protein